MDNQEQEESKSSNNAIILEERAIDQKIVPFLDDELAAALSPGGSIYVSLPGICRALGLNTQAQLRRIQRTRTLSKGLRLIELRTKGGFQRFNCLRVDLIALWLAGLQTSNIREEFRSRIEEYQDELAPVAMQVFMRVVGTNIAQVVPTEDLRIHALAEQIDTLTEVTSFLREHMEAILEAQGHTSMQLEQAVSLLEALTNRQETTETTVAKIDERTKRLTPAHAREVQNLVERIAGTLEKHSPRVNGFAMVYGRLKDRFKTGSYKEIPDERFTDVMTYLRQEARKLGNGEEPKQENLF